MTTNPRPPCLTMPDFVSFQAITPADRNAIAHIVCTLLGIGALSMPHNFAEAGLGYGMLALILVCVINIYATLCLSQCLRAAPQDVETYTDLGFFIFGPTGRVMIQATQVVTCLLVPIVLLILGGQTLLPGIFFEMASWKWILVMALSLFPICLQKTLTEAYGMMLLGFLSALFSIIVAVMESAVAEPWTHYAPSEIHWTNVMGVFGALALSYGAALVTPGIQRHHPHPKHMPQNILLSMAFVTVIYLTIALIGFAQYGCSTPANLLHSMTSGGWKRLGFGLMQIHITIAFPVILFPALVTIEKAIFPAETEMTSNSSVMELELAITPKAEEQPKLSKTTLSFPPLGNFTTNVSKIAFRSTVVVLQIFVAILLREAFSDAADFIGATTITLCCIVFPLAFKLKMFGRQMNRGEKLMCVMMIFLSLVFGLYTAYRKLEHMIDSVQQGSYKLFSDASPAAEEHLHPHPQRDLRLCPAGYVYN